MKVLTRIATLFGGRPLPRMYPHSADYKRLMARHSRGNVLLQQGRMMTRGEFEEMERRVLSHD